MFLCVCICESEWNAWVGLTVGGARSHGKRQLRASRRSVFRLRGTLPMSHGLIKYMVLHAVDSPVSHARTIYGDWRRFYILCLVCLSFYAMSLLCGLLHWPTDCCLEGQLQGSHKSGKPWKPGIVREFCKPGKVREFAIWSGNFLWDVAFFASCLSMSWSLHVMCKLN